MNQLTINDHFFLRQTVPGDEEETFAVVDRNRAYLRQWMGWVDSVQSPDDIRPHLKTLQKENAAPEYVLIEHGNIIGRLGFHAIDARNRSTSIGYWLDEARRGNGLMTSAVNRLLDHAFGPMDLHRVVLQAAVENHASRAIATRCGFTQEGTARQAEWLYDHFADLAVYGKLRDDN